jgi:hypothetical protein
MPQMQFALFGIIDPTGEFESLWKLRDGENHYIRCDATPNESVNSAACQEM